MKETVKEIVFSENKKYLLIKCLVLVFAFGLIAHAYCYFNGNFTHDALLTVDSSGDNIWQVVGRILIPGKISLKIYV